MKISLWKKWLSYLMEIPVESMEGEGNVTLNVSLIKGRYQLYTEKAIYSFSDLYYNFDTAFKKVDVQNQNIKTVLLLGVGLGSIPLLLEKKYGLDCTYTGVEWDENVLYLAEKYTLTELNSPMTMIAADAAIYMQQNDGKYDLICMDIFVDDMIPVVFQSQEFLEDLKGSLTNNGILMYNCLYRNEEDQLETENFLETKFSKKFTDVEKLLILGNCILIGKNHSN